VTRRLALGAAALAAVVAGCGSSEPVIPPSQIARAAFTSTNGPGFKYALTVDASADGQSISVTGHGAIDSKNERGTLTMEIEGTTAHVLIDPPYIYTRTGDSGPWVRTKSDDPQLQQNSGASGVSGQATSDPSSIIKFLNSAESVKNVGTEDVNGTPTTHYTADIDLEKQAKTEAPSERAETNTLIKLLKATNDKAVLPIDVFIDDTKHVRRAAFKLDICTTEGDVSIGLKFDFLSYGPQTVPGLPHGDEVRDGGNEHKSSSQDFSQLTC
jgi:hypothetical protein